jgi:hypothetical protein
MVILLLKDEAYYVALFLALGLIVRYERHRKGQAITESSHYKGEAP